MSKLPDLAALRKLVAASACEEKQWAVSVFCVVTTSQSIHAQGYEKELRSWQQPCTLLLPHPGAHHSTHVWYRPYSPWWDCLQPQPPFLVVLFRSKHSGLGPVRDPIPGQVSYCLDVSKSSMSLLRSLYHVAPGPSEPQRQAPQEQSTCSLVLPHGFVF